MTRVLFKIFFILGFSIQGFSQLTIKLTSVPINTPSEDPIHIAGDFQGWDPSDLNSQLTNNGDGTYEIELNLSPGMIEFKFTRGSWAQVEGNDFGGFLPNRTFNYDGNATTLELTILSWEDLGGTGNSTAVENVFVMDDDFAIPQLNRTRRVWIYLPPDYSTSEKDYPVLYMHDGQNVFDLITSFSGEWEVDESLNQLFDEGDFGCIVVAVDNGGTHRINEYSPWLNPSYGGGEGGAYMDFLVNTLKPHIDANYRTLPAREYTGIMGSSLGGLISHYAIVEHQAVYSKAGIFSPSYWFVDEVYTHTETTPKTDAVRIYTIAGQFESASMVSDINEMENTLLNAGYESDELMKHIHADGAHSEWYWAREFPDAYEWLFGDLDLTDVSTKEAEAIQIFPNPVQNILKIIGFEQLSLPNYKLVSISGNVIKTGALDQDELDLNELSAGFYWLEIYSKESRVFVEKIIIQK